MQIDSKIKKKKNKNNKFKLNKVWVVSCAQSTIIVQYITPKICSASFSCFIVSNSIRPPRATCPTSQARLFFFIGVFFFLRCCCCIFRVVIAGPAVNKKPKKKKPLFSRVPCFSPWSTSSSSRIPSIRPAGYDNNYNADPRGQYNFERAKEREEKKKSRFRPRSTAAGGRMGSRAWPVRFLSGLPPGFAPVWFSNTCFNGVPVGGACDKKSLRYCVRSPKRLSKKENEKAKKKKKN